jgi:hypothetical protein
MLQQELNPTPWLHNIAPPSRCYVITPKHLTVAAELECSPMTIESHVLLGAEFQLTRSKIGVVVDGEGKDSKTAFSSFIFFFLVAVLNQRLLKKNVVLFYNW